MLPKSCVAICKHVSTFTRWILNVQDKWLALCHVKWSLAKILHTCDFPKMHNYGNGMERDKHCQSPRILNRSLNRLKPSGLRWMGIFANGISWTAKFNGCISRPWIHFSSRNATKRLFFCTVIRLTRRVKRIPSNTLNVKCRQVCENKKSVKRSSVRFLFAHWHLVHAQPAIRWLWRSDKNRLYCALLGVLECCQHKRRCVSLSHVRHTKLWMLQVFEHFYNEKWKRKNKQNTI